MLVRGMLGKEFLCRADSCFSTAVVLLTNITSNLGGFHPETFQLLSALFVFVFY